MFIFKFLSRIWRTIQIAIQFDQLNQVYQKRLKSLKNFNVPLSPQQENELELLEKIENYFSIKSLKNLNVPLSPQQENELELLEKIENYFSKLLSPSDNVPRREIRKLINKIERCTDFNNEELSREVFQLFSYLDASIAQEDNLLSQRFNLFLVAQTFLIAGYIQSFSFMNVSTSIPGFISPLIPKFNSSFSLSHLLAWGIAVIGFCTSIASDGNVRLSIQAIEYYKDYYQQLKNEFSKHSYDYRLRPFKHRVSLYFGYYPDIYFDHTKQAKGLTKYYANWIDYITRFFIVVWIILFLLVYWVSKGDCA
jgi:hypothetical protein